MHQSKDNLEPIVPLILTCVYKELFANYIARLHMERATTVPHLRNDQDLFESTQKFACRMITKTRTKAMMSF